MDIWQIWVIAGLALLILEMFTPLLFFLSLAFAALLTAALSLYVDSLNWQVGFFAVLSILSLFFIRPLLLKGRAANGQTGIEAKYVGNIAKSTQKINANEGRAAIYGEAWDARTLDGSEIEENQSVEIVKVENLTLFVKKKEI